MHESPSKRQRPSTGDAVETRETGLQEDRERLINDLAFLVVRQHHDRQRLKADSDQASTSVNRPER